jgi:hypothetical protein
MLRSLVLGREQAYIKQVAAAKSTYTFWDKSRYLPISRRIRHIVPNTIENSIINNGAVKRTLE